MNGAPSKRPRPAGNVGDFLTREQRADFPQPERKAGRPRKLPEDAIQTTFRLTVEDHAELRILAFRDRMSMNDLIFRALREYCEGRSVKLKGGAR